MNIYDKNIQALEKHHPHLKELLESLNVDEDKVKVLRADSGEPRVLYNKDDGDEVYIHNAEDPSLCAKQATDLLGQMEKEGIAVIFGFGLGYFAEEVYARFEKGHILIIYEATPELFKTALMTRDLSELFESEKVNVLLGADADNLSLIHTHHNLIANGKFWVVKHHPSTKLNEGAYEKFFNKLQDEKRLSDSGVATAISLGKEFINTFVENIPAIIRKPGVNKLQDLFKGRPAIIVSAGPSLEKNVHLLREAKNKALIIAVDVVLPTLLPMGIIPDFLVAIDPLPENLAVYRDIPILKKVPFVCLAQYTPEIVNIYPGPIFMNTEPNNYIFQWLGRYWEDKGYVECFGGSVAHLAFALAQYVGADVIALIGQDLSFDNKLHAGDITKIICNFTSPEVPDYRKGADVVVDIFGDTKYSRASFLSFKTSLENRIKVFQGKVVNATEGGLAIEGTDTMRFVDFMDEYCNLSEIDSDSVLTEAEDNSVRYNLDGLISEIEAANDKFRELKRISSRVYKHLKRLKSLKRKGQEKSDEFHNILNKIESLIEQVKHPLLNLLVGYNYSLELYMKKQDTIDIDEIGDEWERLNRQIERGLIYYKEIVMTVDIFNKRLDKLICALKREKKINCILSDKSSVQRDRYYEIGMVYKKAGLATQAVNYLERAIKAETNVSNANHDKVNKDSKYYSLQISLAEMYMKQFRFYEALEVLGAVQEGGSGDRVLYSVITRKVEPLLKICNKKIREWEDRQNRTGKLIIKSEINYGSHRESGYFYFRIKDFKRAEKSYLKSIESHDNGENPKELVESYYGLAHTYLAVDDPENAVQALEKAIEIDPSNPVLYRDLGILAIQYNNIESAEIFLAKAIELAPEEAELYKPLANFYMSQGKTEKAIALYEKALLSSTNNLSMQQELASVYRASIAKAEGC